MKYTKEQRLDIAKRVYDGELTVEEAAVKYDLNPSSVKGYLRLIVPKRGFRPERALRKLEKSHSLLKLRKIPVSRNMNPCQKKNSLMLSSWHGSTKPV